MIEKTMDVKDVLSYLKMTLRAKKVKVRESNCVITIIPVDEEITKKDFSCPFLGIAVDSNITVDKFLEWKREERAVEYEKELRS